MKQSEAAKDLHIINEGHTSLVMPCPRRRRKQQAATIVSAVLTTGCATAPLSPTVMPARPAAVAQVEAPAPAPVVAVPEITTCAEAVHPPPPTDDPAPPADTRCAREVMVSTAMSDLGKTSAEFDEISATLVLREYDADELLAEALADPRFRLLVALSDVKPRDGMLSASEAVEVEAAVLKHLDAQL